ncbi:MAG: hypothetical protein KatS3mg060_3484 [Dehalococcoidia bacterium]|nr:MAG: hypothetical protein KatS3mg060_3484 [Dehalococcoidia bacterium]
MIVLETETAPVASSAIAVVATLLSLIAGGLWRRRRGGC